MATRQQILDDNWLEFIEFYRAIAQKSKEEENELNGDIMSILIASIDDEKSDKLKHSMIYQQFSDPNETTFWRWYALIKLNNEE